jgi:hypothetical protein
MCLMWGSPCGEGRLTEWNDQGKLANRKAVYSPVLATLLSTRENLFERLVAYVRRRSVFLFIPRSPVMQVGFSTIQGRLFSELVPLTRKSENQSLTVSNRTVKPSWHEVLR